MKLLAGVILVVILTGVGTTSCVTDRTTDFSRGGITGVVYDEEGGPVAGAIIRVGFARRGRSDNFGRFRLENVPAGELSLAISAPGYEAAAKDVHFENRTHFIRVDLTSFSHLAELAIAAGENRDWNSLAELVRRMERVYPEDERTRLAQRIARTQGILDAPDWRAAGDDD